jgi:small-conductance mechanosensitive channel
MLEASSWLGSSFLGNLLTTSLFICGLFFLRFIAERRIHDMHPQWTTEERLKSIGTLRTAVSTLLIVGFFYIWAEALHAFAVSVFAIALAFVVASKELIICVHGYILLLRGQFYQLGDRIEVAGARGDVVNINVLSTTILEVGHGQHGHQKTGRQLSFPNSILMNHFVHNESTFENFAMITVSVPLHVTQDWQLAKAFLLESAQKECESFLEHARKKMKEIQRKRGIDLPSPDPRVNIELPNHEEIILHLRVPCPLHLRENIEQAILNRFMDKLAAAKIKGVGVQMPSFESIPRPESSSSPSAQSSLSESSSAVAPGKAKIPIIDA